ncbi:NADH-ubiquinone oxidoreductase [Histoplasma capsulatum G186AR]|uniref:NADH-ubiquinone oxidoreductase n=1 Tax=Ajellomyces capsulatus TaxID=5037 RepID=A0A8H7Z798_AJECA|nr:NADH-ubiquinone oxidoreductase [Histoplasma capsulatum]QSS72187.1 NADH-ubiquinone oxidoreductase [Histoplasma capsulatum G186AR]
MAAVLHGLRIDIAKLSLSKAKGLSSTVRGGRRWGQPPGGMYGSVIRRQIATSSSSITPRENTANVPDVARIEQNASLLPSQDEKTGAMGHFLYRTFYYLFEPWLFPHPPVVLSDKILYTTASCTVSLLFVFTFWSLCFLPWLLSHANPPFVPIPPRP